MITDADPKLEQLQDLPKNQGEELIEMTLADEERVLNLLFISVGLSSELKKALTIS